MSVGRTLKIFVMGNDPHCLKQVEIVNWTGFAFIGGREHVQQARRRPELSTPGLYFLLSDAAENDGGLIDFYVGETDDFSARIIDHIGTKDWWTKFVVFTSKDQNLTKAHVKFLEREIYKLAQENVALLRLRNEKKAGGATLPESDIASMREFLENMCFVLEAMGLSYFPTQGTSIRSTEVAAGSLEQNNHDVSEKDRTEFSISLSKDASGGAAQRSFLTFSNGVYVLRAGSFITKVARDSFETHDSYYALWKQIIESNAVEASEFEGLLRTTRDLEFRSPSAAGAVVRARSTNGRSEWKRIGDGESLAKCLVEIGDKKVA